MADKIYTAEQVKRQEAAAKGGSFVQYDRRHVNGQLFSCVAKTLQAARQRYKKWAEQQH